jgi:hypothetical protein
VFFFWQKICQCATWKVALQQLKGSIKKIQKIGVQSKNPQILKIYDIDICQKKKKPYIIDDIGLKGFVK